LIAYYKCILLRRTKFGLDEEELNSIMASSEFQEMKTYTNYGVNGNVYR
jgi:hypothetical protein